MRFVDIGQTLMGSILLHIASTGTAAYLATRKDIQDRGGLRHLMIFSCVLSIFCFLGTMLSLISPGDKLRGKLGLLVFLYILNGILGGFGCAYAFGLAEKRFRYLLRDEKAVVAFSVLGGCMFLNLIAAFLLIRCREVLSSLKRTGMLPRGSLWSSFCEDRGDGGSESSEFEHDPTYKGRSGKPSFGKKNKRANQESSSSDEEEQLLKPGVGIGAPQRPIVIAQNDDSYGPPQIGAGRGIARAQEPFVNRAVPSVERQETVGDVQIGRGGIARPHQVEENTVNDSVYSNETDRLGGLTRNVGRAQQESDFYPNDSVYSNETERLGGLVRNVGKPRPAVVSVAPSDSVYSNETERLGGLNRGVAKTRGDASAYPGDSVYSDETERLGGLNRGIAKTRGDASAYPGDSVYSNETERLGGFNRGIAKTRRDASAYPGDSVYSDKTERLGGLTREVGKTRQLESVVSGDSAYSNETGRLGGLTRGVARADKNKTKSKPLRTEQTMEVESSSSGDDDGRISSVGGAIPKLGGKRL